MVDFLGFPVISSRHGLEIDYMNGWVHWLMLILFVGWGIFFIYVLFRFRSGSNPKASYEGVTSHISRYTEYGIIIIEAILLIGFAYPMWAKVKTQVPAIDENTIEVRVIAQQFAWNVHYPGQDGLFGDTNSNLVDEEVNPIGLDRNSSNGKDDITTINQLHLPVNKQAMIYLSSKDVIHSLSLPEMRVKQDAIPGMTIPVFFTPTMTSSAFLETIKGTAREGMGYEIACAQLCGNTHLRMKGYLTVHEDNGFEDWLDKQAAELEEEGDDWGDDDDW